MPYDTTQWIWAGGALIAMVALLLLLGRAARLIGIAPLGAGQRLRIEESLALDARRRITLLHIDGRTMVLLTGGATDLCLGWVPESAP